MRSALNATAQPAASACWQVNSRSLCARWRNLMASFWCTVAMAMSAEHCACSVSSTMSSVPCRVSGNCQCNFSVCRSSTVLVLSPMQHNLALNLVFVDGQRWRKGTGCPPRLPGRKNWQQWCRAAGPRSPATGPLPRRRATAVPVCLTECPTPCMHQLV